MEAQFLTDALEEAVRIVRECNSHERRHDKVVIVEASNAALIDVNQIIRDMKAEKSADAASRQEMEERAELERLTKKYR